MESKTNFLVKTQQTTDDPQGTEYTLAIVSDAEKAIVIKLLNYGATIISIATPNREKNVEEITVCYPTITKLKTKLGPYFGCIAGRVANRIKEGKFSIDGENYTLPVNNGPNSLHGGLAGFDKKYWNAEIIPANTSGVGVRFSLTSPDGDEGYPGTVEVFVTYFLSFNSEYVPELSIEYAATTSKPTPINLTNHTYFNLSGNCSRNILQQKLLLNCDRYLPVSASQIPTGELASVEGTPFDFTKNATSYGKILGDAIPVIDGGGRPGVDHCFVINGAVESYSASSLHASPLRLVGYLTDEVSGRQLTVKSTCPGAQIYTANWLSTDPIDHPYTQYNGVCLETQHFPDSINQPAFPSCLLRPENQYHQKTVLTFSIIL